MAVTAVFRRLEEIDPAKFASLESQGVCVIDAGGDGNICDLAKLYSELGKWVLALCDNQDAAQTALIQAEVEKLYMHQYQGFEELVLNNTTAVAKQRFAGNLDWPQWVRQNIGVDPATDIEAALAEYFKGTKGEGTLAEFLVQCEEAEIPEWIRDCCIDIKRRTGAIEPEAPADGGDDEQAADSNEAPSFI